MFPPKHYRAAPGHPNLDFLGRRFWMLHDGGFSLLELLVVVSVLAVLMVFSIPVVSFLIDRAKGVSCASNMRQLGGALHSYRVEHNGWYPPGYPAAPKKIDGAQPPQNGIGGINLTSALVPDYISEWPLCPGMRLTPEGRKRYPDEKRRLREISAGYAVNAILLQWKLEAMPWPGWKGKGAWSASKTPFVLESGVGGATWAFTHQNQAIIGIDKTGYDLMGRSHGMGDTLNFLFLDGHMQAISRNDQREDSDKSWVPPSNPNGQFNAGGDDGLYISHTQMSETQFKQSYPNFYPQE